MRREPLHAIRTILLTVCALLAAVPATYADGPDKLGPYKQIATVTVPSGLAGGFDISWVDNGRYYLADRGNAKATPPVPPGVDVLSVKHPKFLFAIPLPTSLGTNGVVVIHQSGDDSGEGDDEDQSGTLVVGGNDSNTYFVDLAHPFAAPILVSTGGKVRADELAYDPKDQIILITNPDEGSATPPGVPFISFISSVTHKLLGKIIYDGAPGDGPDATAGIEQPVWDGARGRFYINIPSTPANPHGEVDEIDPVAMKITNTFSTPCPAPFGPLGLALIPGQRLMNSCGDVLDIASGTVVKTQTGILADEIWFNPGDERVYFGSFTTTPVVDGLPPYDVIPGGLPWMGTFPTKFSHSVAVDPVFNHSFVPVSNTGILVFTDDHDFGGGPND
jgi:hypothetical protein